MKEYKTFNQQLFDKYKNEFQIVSFDDILNIMGIEFKELEKLR